MIKFLIGGSPCTHWSVARLPNAKRETEPSGVGWELFRNYLIAKEKFNPDFFLYENNKSASQAIKDQISHELGAPLQYINSALVSAQNRQRFYVHNFGNVPQPKDRNISFQSIMETDPEELERFKVPRTPSRERMWNGGNGCKIPHSCKNITYEKKTCCLTTKQDRSSNTGLHPYKVTDQAYSALIDLLVDICRRNGIKALLWKGDKSLIGQVDKQNMTVHRWFANKACPGDYLYNLHGQIAAQVNERLGAATPAEPEKKPTSTTTFTPYLVRITASVLNIRKGPGTSYAVTGQIKDRGVYTIVEQNGNWGRLKSGAGWISLSYAKKV